MMRLCAVALGMLSLVACVDGKTPDCSTVASGCFPEDAASGADASDAGDAAKDAGSDASTSDAASDAADAAD